MSLIPLKGSLFLRPSLFLTLFAFFYGGLQNVNAQALDLARDAVVKMPYATADTLSACYQLTTCNDNGPSDEAGIDSPRWTDDGTNDGNYADGHERRDTIEFCPEDKWHRVKIVFTAFDLERNDTLFAYQGTKILVEGGLAPSDTATLTGASRGFGGWIAADCNPRVNPSGCLTFEFRTDGQNTKGAGWDAWVDCEDRDISVETVSIPNRKLTCDSAAYGIITIPAPVVKICNTAVTVTANDSVQLVVTNQHGEVCIDSCITLQGMNNAVTDTFAIGSYKATYILKADPEKTSTSIFSVQAPSLVCNDEINIPLGSACMIVLTPDDILEQPCDTIHDTMYYNITITLGTGKDQVVLKTENVENANAPVVYPIITADTVRAAGMTVCNAMATVTIERIYYGTTDTLTFCNNGPQSTTCETTVNFGDQTIPWVSVVPGIDTIIACDTTGLATLLAARAIDNCDDNLPITYTVTLAETDPCFAAEGKPDTTTATVLFSAVDDCGNVGTFEKEYTIIRPNKADHIAKTANVTVECSEDRTAISGVPGMKIGTLQNGVFTATDTIELSVNEYICGYILTKRDENIPSNDCGEKVFRYWSLLDWCKPELGPVACDTTFIQYTDTEAPIFDEGEGANRTLELGHFDCTFDIFKLDIPRASDNCDLTPTVRLDRITIIEDGNKTDWVVDPSDYTTLPCDSFCLRWIAEDACHEQLVNDTLLQIVVIKDVTKPSAVAVDQLNVSLPNEWGARVRVDDIDAGSYDACGIKTREIRIKGAFTDANEGWADFVDIGCEYVHPDLQIELRITDNKDNQNIAWTDIFIEDKIRPICTAPAPPPQRFCDEFHNGELGAPAADWTDTDDALRAIHNRYFGEFTCEDNLNAESCGDLETEEQYRLREWPCGEIELDRRHRAIDWSGNVSEYAFQYDTIEYRAAWSFTVPADWEGACGEQVIAPEIIINNGPCDLLGFEVTSRLFEIPGDACFKMERTYHIINWCAYQAGQAPVEIARVEAEHNEVLTDRTIDFEGNADKGYFTYVQILKIHDDEGPVVTVFDPEPCINGVDFDAEPYGEEDITPGSAPYECDEQKTWRAEATDCSDPSVITWIGMLYDVNGNVVKEVKENFITFPVTNKTSYRAEFWAFDGCGNSTGASGEIIKFWDCKKPTPYLLNGIVLELGETGSIQAWSTDLDRGSFDNCTDQSFLDLRIYHADLGDAPAGTGIGDATEAGVTDLPKVITFGCNRVGTQAVRIYVIDEEENWDFVETFLIIQDNMNVCNGGDPQGMSLVAGTIRNGFDQTVESVTVAVNGAEERVLITETDGQYQFMLSQGGDYTLTPAKDRNPLNGVSTFDLVLISQHILGTKALDSPFKQIAADVNKSGTITAFDMVQLRQLILNVTTEFPNNTSWRFVEAGYTFTSSNPAAENFNEFVSVNNLATNREAMDFTAVKIGDVNGSGSANSLLTGESRTTNGTVNLDVMDRFVEAGQSVTVEFAATDLAKTSGYQFTLNVAGKATIIEGLAKAAHFNMNLAERGVITTSWNGETPIATETNEVLFGLTFIPNRTGLLSEMIEISSAITTAEAYNTDGDLLNVAINFNSATTTKGFVLNQNTPNPFNGATTIGFNLPTAGIATLKVMDIQGKVLKTIEADYAKGYNHITLSTTDLGATGILYYQLEAADNVATKKMIIIE